MASRGLLAAAVVLTLAVSHLAVATTGTERHRTLVLIGDEGARQTHSKYLAALEPLGTGLAVRLSSDSKLQLRHWDALLYETVILLHPEAKGSDLAPASKAISADACISRGACCHA